VSYRTRELLVRVASVLFIVLASSGCTCQWIASDDVSTWLDDYGSPAVDYDGGSNMWSDMDGRVFGTSAAEDSDLCLFVGV
jgi:hypothetical protein